MILKFDYIFFDLDGTLTDPGEGITNSVAYALEKFGIATEDKTCLYRFIGPPLAESFEKYYGFTPQDAERAVGYYREYFGERGIYENLIYDGIFPLLSRLSDTGARIILATSKPGVYAARILRHFGIDGFFHFTAGSCLDGTRTKKADVIGFAIESIGLTDRSCAVMVGDREHDIIGAKQTNLASVGVLYGYGDRAELEGAGADFIARTVFELEQLLLG